MPNKVINTWFLGTVVLANIYAAAHDEKVFKDAYKFKADRFVGEDGKFQKPDSKQFIPFSIGRWLFEQNLST